MYIFHLGGPGVLPGEGVKSLFCENTEKKYSNSSHKNNLYNSVGYRVFTKISSLFKIIQTN